ncbi:MAG: winged helix-turn-helix domain-containing protein [Spirochaetota bacterium]
MKSSRRSSASSRKNPDPPTSELWLVGVDDYTGERIRLAFESETRWIVRGLDDTQARVSASAGEVPVLIIRPVGVAARSDGPLPRTGRFPPVLLYGSPASLDTLGDDVCDDVLVEPWAAQELRYRVRRLLERVSLRCAGGRLHWGRYWIAADGEFPNRRVDISPVQLAMLEMLARAGDDPVPREALQAVVPDHGPTSRAVDMQLSRLRGRLALAAAAWPVPPTISCSRGRGYRLECR